MNLGPKRETHLVEQASVQSGVGAPTRGHICLARMEHQASPDIILHDPSLFPLHARLLGEYRHVTALVLDRYTN